MIRITFEGGRERWVSQDGSHWVTEYPDGRVEVIAQAKLEERGGQVSYVKLDELTKRALLTILDELEEAQQQAMRREA